jgi:PAS domain S-box-containing protein
MRLSAAQLLASIVESSDDAIVSKDLNGIVTSWNKSAERLFGYTAWEMIGSPILTIIPPDRHHEEPDILSRIRRGERVDHYETVRRRKDGRLVDVSITVSPVKDSRGKVVGASKIARDITEAKQAQARQELLHRELAHRTGNLFAVVQAVVARSFAGKRTVDEAEAAVLGRLHSLAQTHIMLDEEQANVAELGDVIRNEMGSFSQRVAIDGPRVQLVAKPAQNFTLAVHELATNAAKYGALSNASGYVRISWHVDESTNRLHFRWEERGGPHVAMPTRKGFGSVVLEQVMAEYCDHQPALNFDPRGISYTVTCLLDALTPP